MSQAYTSPSDHRALVNGHRETANTPTTPCPDCGKPVGPRDGQTEDGACSGCAEARASDLAEMRGRASWNAPEPTPLPTSSAMADGVREALDRTRSRVGVATHAKSAGMDAVVLDMIALRVAEALKRAHGYSVPPWTCDENLIVNLLADLRTIALHVESSGRKVEGL